MIEPDESPTSTATRRSTSPATTPVDAWRGVAAEDVDEPSAGLAGLLRSRSRRLLGSLLRPHRRSLLARGAAHRVQHRRAAARARCSSQIGIDNGIPPLLDGGSGSLVPLASASSSALVVITLLGAVDVQRVPADHRARRPGRACSTCGAACSCTSRS